MPATCGGSSATRTGTRCPTLTSAGGVLPTAAGRTRTGPHRADGAVVLDARAVDVGGELTAPQRILAVQFLEWVDRDLVERDPGHHRPHRRDARAELHRAAGDVPSRARIEARCCAQPASRNGAARPAPAGARRRWCPRSSRGCRRLLARAFARCLRRSDGSARGVACVRAWLVPRRDGAGGGQPVRRFRARWPGPVGWRGRRRMPSRACDDRLAGGATQCAVAHGWPARFGLVEGHARIGRIGVTAVAGLHEVVSSAWIDSTVPRPRRDLHPLPSSRLVGGSYGWHQPLVGTPRAGDATTAATAVRPCGACCCL